MEMPRNSSIRRPSTGPSPGRTRRAPRVSPITRPDPSSLSAASGSTSRNSGLAESRSTQSRLLSAIRLAISTRRAAAVTRLMASFWLLFGAGERSSEMSSTAVSAPRLS